jgi:hypothetical protein
VGETVKKNTPHTCNILKVSPEARQLWQFSTRNSSVHLVADRTIPISEPLPVKVVGKDWKTVFQRKLNLAWVPPDQVFLRVLQLPACEFPELHAMVELQLEKLSPLPTNQIVWSIELLPQKAPTVEQTEKLQTLIVIIVARTLIEQFLGKLETEGYLADRLEIPCLHQLLHTPVEGDGVWVYPSVEGGQNLCLIAWWYGGSLQQLQILHLPEDESGRAAFVVEQLTKMAWAGEVEGWLTAPAGCHLVADETIASAWETVLRPWSATPVQVTAPLPTPKLGELAARRASRGETKVNLLPPEYAVRYRQQVVDRLWMGGLGAILAVYVVGVIIYFGAVQVLSYQQNNLESQIAAVANDYTNTVRLKERIEVLQNQLHLKYAALDSLHAVANSLPGDLTLTSFHFQRGQRVLLTGIAPSDQVSQLINYNDDLRKARVGGSPIFSNVSPPNYSSRPGPAGSQMLGWNFTCELNLRDSQ